MEQLIQWLTANLSSVFSGEFVAFFISILPVLELRGGMIAARLLGVNWPLAFALCIIGNLLPIPFILIFIKKIFARLKNTRLVKFINKLEEKANKKSEKILKYKHFGLFFFVAVPLPGTGAWTGAMIAALLNMKLRQTFWSIAFGVIAAGLIMSIAYII